MTDLLRVKRSGIKSAELFYGDRRKARREKRWSFYGKNPDRFVYENSEYERDSRVLHSGGISAAAAFSESAQKISVCAVAGGGFPADLSGVGEYGIQPVQSGSVFRTGAGDKGRRHGVSSGVSEGCGKVSKGAGGVRVEVWFRTKDIRGRRSYRRGGCAIACRCCPGCGRYSQYSRCRGFVCRNRPSAVHGHPVSGSVRMASGYGKIYMAFGYVSVPAVFFRERPAGPAHGPDGGSGRTRAGRRRRKKRRRAGVRMRRTVLSLCHGNPASADLSPLRPARRAERTGAAP